MAITYTQTASWATAGTFVSGQGCYKDVTLTVASGDLLMVFGAAENYNLSGGTRSIVTQSGATTNTWTPASPTVTLDNDVDVIGGWTKATSAGSITIRVQLRTASGGHMGAGVLLIPAAEHAGSPGTAVTFAADADGQASATLAATSTVFYGGSDWAAAAPGTGTVPTGGTPHTTMQDGQQYSVAVRSWTGQTAGTRAYGPSGLTADDYSGVIFFVQEASSTTQVTKSAASSWSVRSQVSATKAAAWSLRSVVTATRSAAWTARSALTASAATAWSVRSSTTRTVGTAWSARALVTSLAPSAWSVLARVTSAAGTAWSSRTTITSSKSVAWSARALVAATRDTAWSIASVLTTVTRTAQAAWSTRAAVTATRGTAWSARTQVSTARDTAWSSRERVTAAAPAAWSARAQVTATTPAAWTVRAITSRVTAAAWSIRERVTTLLATAWDVRVLVGPEVEPPPLVDFDVVSGPHRHPMQVTGPARRELAAHGPARHPFTIVDGPRR